MAWFDTQSQAQIVASFTRDSMALQMAIGEKISSVISLVSTLISGLAFSFYIGWVLTLIVLACLPIIGYFWFKDTSLRLGYIKKRD
jgi:ATP-binding cassette, subfamily B (MDR/TAP), member 1